MASSLNLLHLPDPQYHHHYHQQHFLLVSSLSSPPPTSCPGRSRKKLQFHTRFNSSYYARWAAPRGDFFSQTSEVGEYSKDNSSCDNELRTQASIPTWKVPSLGTALGKSGLNTTCFSCGRRHMLGALGTILSLDAKRMANASLQNSDPQRIAETVHPPRPEWYEELYAIQMDSGMKSYENQMAGYKAQLFRSLDGKVQKVLELGIGTGPNIKYYSKSDVSIIGVDPNSHMEKYARAAALAAGLLDSQFKFLRGVGEALPVPTSSVDAVVCTLVLCSVKDVAATLKEIQRVLRPGGSLLFIEHVVAPEGSGLRFWQNLLDPVQQFVADGCHLTRNTLKSIQQAEFAVVDAKNISIPNVSLFSAHIIGIAQI